MVNVGVIGLGPQWEGGYRTALERSRSRIAIRAVYDAVGSRAAHAAADWSAAPSDGIRALLKRPDVRAVLLLDPAWQGTRPFEFILASRKPALLGAWPDLDPANVAELARHARSDSLTLIPAFPQRYMPSTARLRELIATRIGRPRRITIRGVRPCGTAHAEAGPDERLAPRAWLHLFDWCRQVIRTPPARVTAGGGEAPPGGSAGIGRLEIEYRQPRDGESCRVEIESDRRDAGDSPAREPGHAEWLAPVIEVDAERGRAALDGPCRIRWSSSDDWTEECLSSERTEFEVMLDLFCRRVVGGLIPVADFGDIARGHALWSACCESLHTAGPVSLDGQDV